MRAVTRAIYARWARTSNSGAPVRCVRGKGSKRGYLFPTRQAAEQAALELATTAGEAYRPVPCTLGRHWHLRPVETVKEAPDAGELTA